MPIFATDVFEHAYIARYGLKKADCAEAFIRNINWEVLDEGAFRRLFYSVSSTSFQLLPL
ncbi:Fe-Mn family superoxide dismutase [Chloroflexota bacterium]